MWSHISLGRCSTIRSDLFIFNIYNMEKLHQLLNEYERSLWSDREWLWIIDEDWFFCTRKSKKGNLIVQHSSLDEAILQIISKKFWFIQWLVDNDRIDIQWAKNLLYESEIFNPLPYTDLAERLIMYLAIQDDPISFLVSILK